jgi:hypothetical protein
MTNPGRARSPTALDLLFGSADAPEALAREIMARGVDQTLGLGNLPPAVRATAVREAATVAAGLLQADVIELLVGGWREYREIVAAARSTLAVPGSTELVGLVTHQVTVAQHPSVSVLVDSRRVGTLQLDLSLVFTVTAMEAQISGGRLVALHSGRCDVTAALAVQGIELMARQAHFDLPGVVTIGQGIRLLPAAEYAAGTHAAGEHRSGPAAASTPWWENVARVPPPGRPS